MKTLKTLGFSSLLAACVAVGGGATAQPYQKADDVQDMALIYQGGSHRLDWTADEFRPYVVHRFADGTKDWLFDGFLFLEFKNGSGRHYTVGYEKLNARKGEWAWLLDRIFEEGKSLSALDQCITEEMAELGKPGFKHQIVLGLPEAIRDQKDWGELNGRRLDFAKASDRIAAYKWYIDSVRERFAAGGYEHVELAGFYWLRETAAQPEDTEYSYHLTRSDVLLPQIADYLHGLNYSFIWIPYYDARGYDDWRDFGFDQVYLQPNHYWKPENDMDDVCRWINRAGTSIEFEFEASILNARENSDAYRARLRDYMRGAKQYGIYGSRPIAYYQGSNALYDLWVSDDPVDRELFHEFCRFVVGNPLRSK